MKQVILALGLFCTAAFGQTAAASSPRMLCLFLDLGSMSPAEQAKAEQTATQFIQDKTSPSDLIEIATYTSKFNVVQDFTGDRDSLLAALRSLKPAEPDADSAGRLEAMQAAKATLAVSQGQGGLVWVTRPFGTPDYMAALNALRFNVSSASIGVSLLPIQP
jgi:hypothetical protein